MSSRNVDAACIIFNAGLVNIVCTKELFFEIKRNGYSKITVKQIKQLQCSQNIWKLFSLRKEEKYGQCLF